MTSGADLLVQITNKTQSTISVNGSDWIEASSSRVYKLQLPLLMLKHEGIIDVALSGVMIPEAAGSNVSLPSGLCLCIIPNTRIGILAEQSMHITINAGYTYSLFTDRAKPEAVGCGDGS